MMKKVLLALCLIIGFTGNLFAQTPKFEWAALADGMDSDMPAMIKKNDKGEIFILASFHSQDKNENQNTYYTRFTNETPEGDILATLKGFNSTKTNGNPNFAFYKLDKDGNLIWAASSFDGYIDLSNSAMTPTPDGGAAFALKLRYADENALGTGNLFRCRIYDADGKSLGAITDVVPVTDDKETGSLETFGWYYFGYLLKIGADGKAQANQVLYADHSLIDDKKRPDTFDFADILADNDNNLFVSGNYRTTLTLGSGDKALKLDAPHNVEGWTGDVQQIRGDMFFAKLHYGETTITKGYYNDQEKDWVVLTTDGSVAGERPVALSMEGDYAYLCGYMKGAADKSQSVKLGESVLAPTEKNCLYTAKIKMTDGTVEWARIFNTDNQIKPTTISVSGDKVYIGGSFKGIIFDNETEVLNSSYSTLTGYILEADAATGSITAAHMVDGNDADKGKKISEIDDIHTYEDKILATGYRMTDSQYVLSFDGSINNDPAEYTLLTGGGAGTSYGSTLVDNSLVILGRNKSSNSSSIALTGSEFSLSTNTHSWAGILAAYDVSQLPSSINECMKDNTFAFKIYSSKGKLTVESSETCNVNIYSIAGQLVDSFTAEQGTTERNLPAGIYIVNGKKIVIM